MKVLVTGASGFIGGHVARALVDHGYPTRVLLRPGSDGGTLDGLEVERVQGDLRDADAVQRAVAGCHGVVHAAAVYDFWTPEPDTVWDSNVNGTANVLAAARTCGVERVVYTSTESMVGVPARGVPATEALTVRPERLAGDYRRSKYQAEQLALHAARDGLPVVIVNPTAPVGPGDVKPTPTGGFILDFVRGRMPAYVDTGLNLVDVRDVAEGHVRALRRGRVGERYLLGHRNLTFREVLELLAGITGRRAPRLRLPLWLALTVAHCDELVSGRVLGRRPRVTVAAVRSARGRRWFDCSKAVSELGLPQSPIEPALAAAVTWFKEHAYV